MDAVVTSVKLCRRRKYFPFKIVVLTLENHRKSVSFAGVSRATE